MSQIQHTVLFRLPGLTSADQMATCQHLVTQFNDLAGIKASFAATGVPDGAGRVLSLEETVAALDWPDKTTGYSHCLLVIAADVPSLKAYLHSELHSQWAALVKPCADGPPLVFDSPLALSVEDVAGKIQHTVLFKLAVSAEYEPEMQATIAKFNGLPGIQASFCAAGAPGLSLAQTCEALSWPDKTNGFTHCLLVVAADVPSLKSYLHSPIHISEWIGHMKPAGAAGPPIVFDSPLALVL